MNSLTHVLESEGLISHYQMGFGKGQNNLYAVLGLVGLSTLMR